MISPSLLSYIIDFLLGQVKTQQAQQGERKSPHRLIAYTHDTQNTEGAMVVIKPSGFFDAKVYGTPAAEPQLPLAEWQGIPLLFGEARHEWINGGETLVLHADLIASTYYLISRYEEMSHRHTRDKLGRFPGKSSLPFRAGFLHRPIVDEYSEALRRFLVEQGVLEQLGLTLDIRGKGFRRIHLSHDIYRPTRYHGLRAWWQGLWAEQDPYDSFAELLGVDEAFKASAEGWQVFTQLFLKVSASTELDKPGYALTGKSLRYILGEAERIGAKLGLLCSYAASSNPHLIPEEMKELRKGLKKVYKQLHGKPDCPRTSHHQQQNRVCHTDLDLISSRHAYLALAEPEDAREMLAAGIRHDYSMAYADVPGFRLGTCRPVRFINPNTRSLTDLVLHPLTLMDRQLSSVEVMYRDEAEAMSYAQGLIREVYRHGGELNLLWHNDSFAPELHPWLGKFYRDLLAYILSLKE